MGGKQSGIPGANAKSARAGVGCRSSALALEANRLRYRLKEITVVHRLSEGSTTPYDASELEMLMNTILENRSNTISTAR